MLMLPPTWRSRECEYLVAFLVSGLFWGRRLAINIKKTSYCLFATYMAPGFLFPWLWYLFSVAPGFLCQEIHGFLFSQAQVFLSLEISFLSFKFPFPVLWDVHFQRLHCFFSNSFSVSFSRAPVFPFPGLQGFLFTEWRVSDSFQYFRLPGLQGSLISVFQSFVPMFSSSCSLSPLHKATLAILDEPLYRASISAGLLVAAQTRLLSVL